MAQQINQTKVKQQKLANSFKSVEENIQVSMRVCLWMTKKQWLHIDLFNNEN